MRASTLSLFCATALAAPSINHHKHHHKHAARDVDVVTDIVWVTETITLPWPGTDQIPTAAPPAASSASSSVAVVVPPSSSSAVVAPSSASSSAVVVAAAPSSSSVDSAPPSSSLQQGGNTQVPAQSSSAVTSAAAPSSAAASASSAAPPATSSTASTSTSGGLPFTKMVVFGDNLSDNGNGSCAHGVAGNPETIYGFGTWTDGPVAVSYLSTMLGVPLTADYAYGHADGGSKFGATVDNSFTQSDADAPSAVDQIKNYTSTPNYQADVANTLHFLWIGNNDVLPWLMTPVPHIFFGATADSGNTKFATALAAKIGDQVQSLIDAGAEHIFVPNIYPRHIAPVVQRYFTNDTTSIQQYGNVISQANTNLQSILKGMKTKGGNTPVYYDVYGFMNALSANAQAFGADGITHMTPGANICDGAFEEAVAGTTNWDLCQVQKQAGTFYWMQYLDPTTHVHNLIASDMANAVKAGFK